MTALLKERKPEGRLAELLASYERIGGVVEHVLLNENAPAASEYERHKVAAMSFVAAVADRYRPHHKITSEPDRVVGRPISVAEFVGPFYSFEQRRLFLRGRTKNHLNQCFSAGDREKSCNVVKLRRLDESEFVTAAYADAFSDPPYRLSDASPVEVNHLFLGMAAELFNDFQQPLRVFQWSTDWSNYFDDGREWWGSFLWTVDNPARGLLVGVGASATD